jgi:hypothetical protein
MPTASASSPATDTFVTGSVVAARLSRASVENLDPVLWPLLKGQQFFVKHADGRWHPQGCQLGLCECFEYTDLLGPVARGTSARPAIA